MVYNICPKCTFSCMEKLWFEVNPYHNDMKHLHVSPSWPKDQRIFHVCILYTHHTEVTISFGHGLNCISHVIYVLTCDQMISSNVWFYPMGNTSLLGYLRSFKGHPTRTFSGRTFLVATYARLLLATWLLILVGLTITINFQQKVPLVSAHTYSLPYRSNCLVTSTRSLW